MARGGGTRRQLPRSAWASSRREAQAMTSVSLSVSGSTYSDREFIPSAQHAGSSVTLVVRGSRAGYEPQQAASAAVGPVGLGEIIGATPLIDGSPQPGGVLTVLTGSWSPEPLEFTYQWTADGEPIPGAVASSYLLGDDHVGTRIAISVTASRAGYAPLTRVSAEVAIHAAPKTDVPAVLEPGNTPRSTDNSSKLPRTGGQIGQVLPLSLLLLTFGYAILSVSRRRERGFSQHRP